jgi:hypothetical protein
MSGVRPSAVKDSTSALPSVISACTAAIHQYPEKRMTLLLCCSAGANAVAIQRLSVGGLNKTFCMDFGRMLM